MLGPEENKVKSMFAEIANRYDRANTVLSLGLHHSWRKKLVRLSHAQPGESVLDCATGTGDLAIEFKQAVGPSGRVVGTDFCPEMLNSAPTKAQLKALSIEFQVADVLNLPFADQSFNISSISFGIRNVADPMQAIRELGRVVRRETGRVMILEFGQVSTPVIKETYNLYSSQILPRVGGWITGKRDAYQYLQNSSAQFPSGEAFARMMRQTGLFNRVVAKPILFGLAYAYRGDRK